VYQVVLDLEDVLALLLPLIFANILEPWECDLCTDLQFCLSLCSMSFIPRPWSRRVKKKEAVVHYVH